MSTQLWSSQQRHRHLDYIDYICRTQLAFWPGSYFAYLCIGLAHKFTRKCIPTAVAVALVLFATDKVKRYPTSFLHSIPNGAALQAFPGQVSLSTLHWAFKLVCSANWFRNLSIILSLLWWLIIFVQVRSN